MKVFATPSVLKKVKFKTWTHNINLKDIYSIFMFRSTMNLVQVFSKKAAGMEEMKRISDFNLG